MRKFLATTLTVLVMLALFVALGAAFYRTRYGARFEQSQHFGEKLEDYVGDWQCRSPLLDVRVEAELPSRLHVKGLRPGQELVFERRQDPRQFTELDGKRSMSLHGRELTIVDGEQSYALEPRQP